jgi:hypothetical protein
MHIDHFRCTDELNLKIETKLIKSVKFSRWCSIQHVPDIVWEELVSQLIGLWGMYRGCYRVHPRTSFFLLLQPCLTPYGARNT